MCTKTFFRSMEVYFCAMLALGWLTNTEAAKYRVSGPYSKNNLSVYLIHGEDSVQKQNYLTLEEALKNKKIKVYETSEVNQLRAQNLSASDVIYIQAGDIVKGGKQDRVVATDLVLEPGSGKVKIDSFCVEQGRWNQRGAEPAREFNSSTKSLASKDLRLAARLKSSQTDVWNEVDKTQKKLSGNIGKEVKSSRSQSSLQLTLENDSLAEKVDEYKAALLPLLQDKTQVIGYAFSINGELNTADIYANQALMQKLWPKIVDSAATESVAEFEKDLSFKTPQPIAVLNWIEEKKQVTKITREIKPGLKQDTLENSTDVRFDTYSGSGSTKKLYRQNYIKK